MRRPVRPRKIGILRFLLGGLFASLLVALAGQLLAAPVGELIALYGGNFVLRQLSPENIATLCGIGAALGWLGAQLSVAIHLRRL